MIPLSHGMIGNLFLIPFDNGINIISFGICPLPPPIPQHHQYGPVEKGSQLTLFSRYSEDLEPSEGITKIIGTHIS